MNPTFYWKTQLPASIKVLTEDNIRNDIPHLHLNACHSDSVTITLGSSDPFFIFIDGNIKCSCGKVLTNIAGANDGSKLRYTEMNL